MLLKSTVFLFIFACMGSAALNENIYNSDGSLLISGSVVSNFISANYGVSSSDPILTSANYTSSNHRLAVLEDSVMPLYKRYYVIDCVNGIRNPVTVGAVTWVHERIDSTFTSMVISKYSDTATDTSYVEGVKYYIPSYFNGVADGVYNTLVPLGAFFTNASSNVKICDYTSNCINTRKVITIIANESFKRNSIKVFCPLVSIWSGNYDQFSEKYKYSSLLFSLTKLIRKDSNIVYYSISSDSSKAARINLLSGDLTVVTKPSNVITSNRRNFATHPIAVQYLNNRVMISCSSNIKEMLLLDMAGREYKIMYHLEKLAKTGYFYIPKGYSFGQQMLVVKTMSGSFAVRICLVK